MQVLEDDEDDFECVYEGERLNEEPFDPVTAHYDSIRR